ncbi:tetratricopeptide repeat protein [Paenibacillus sp. HWE-109]|uniref:tetratricopeptide repeat protein n=1 Tax=Paenibacillus sp. HWE-109 TaxID=1306526 RepID=UPI001EDCE057|nr:tetratricopeptide repeat protein [Paenibacillus sp. HWE-109]UKS27300.1 tetratricopeptide repeat protein [Paenibacillus sp. HWE-109]
MNLFEQGDELYASGFYQDAYEKFEIAYVNEEENKADCLNYMACCQIHLGNSKQALELLDKALKISPTWERLLFNKGRAYLKLGNHIEALAFFNRAIMANPNNQDAYYYLGVYYEKTAEYEIAKQYYQKSLEIDHEQAETHLNLGIVYWNLGYKGKALKEFDLAYHYDKECFDALWNKGRH